MNPDAVICCLSAKFVHASLAPWCLLAGVRAYAPSLEVQVLETTINRPLEETVDRLAALHPRCISFCAYIWNINSLAALLPLVKKALPDTVLVMGGPEVSYRPLEALAQMPDLSGILCGEGERPFPMLLEAIRGERPFEEVPGLCRQGDREPPAPFIDYAEPPSPYLPEYFEALNGRIAYLETSRGCPYRCAFCLSGRCGGVRFYPIERAKREMLLLANSGTQTVKLVDRTFNCNRQRAKELWQFVIDEQGRGIPKGVCFHFEIAGDILDDESIAILNKAPVGSIQVEIGMQSFYEPTLEAVHRKTNCETLCRNIRKLVAPGNLHIHIDLIAGLPLETYDLFRRSFEIGFGLGSHMLQLGFLKLLPGSYLREHADELGLYYEDIAPYEVTHTKWLSHEELTLLHGIEDAAERLCNSGRFQGTVDYVLETTGLSPFVFFEGMAKELGTLSKISLDDYTSLAMHYMEKLPGIDRELLRDHLVLDRLSANGTGRLPPCLQRRDPRLKKAALWLEKNGYPRKKGIVRGIAFLYGQNALALVDYIPQKRHPVLGRWPVTILSKGDPYEL